MDITVKKDKSPDRCRVGGLAGKAIWKQQVKRQSHYFIQITNENLVSNFIINRIVE